MSVLATTMLMTQTRKKVVKTAKAVGKDSEESKGEYLENFAQVLYIRYPIIFQKKSVIMLVLFNSGRKFNAIYPKIKASY